MFLNQIAGTMLDEGGPAQYGIQPFALYLSAFTSIKTHFFFS